MRDQLGNEIEEGKLVSIIRKGVEVDRGTVRSIMIRKSPPMLRVIVNGADGPRYVRPHRLLVIRNDL